MKTCLSIGWTSVSVCAFVNVCASTGSTIAIISSMTGTLKSTGKVTTIGVSITSGIISTFVDIITTSAVAIENISIGTRASKGADRVFTGGNTFATTSETFIDISARLTVRCAS